MYRNFSQTILCRDAKCKVSIILRIGSKGLDSFCENRKPLLRDWIVRGHTRRVAVLRHVGTISLKDIGNCEGELQITSLSCWNFLLSYCHAIRPHKSHRDILNAIVIDVAPVPRCKVIVVKIRSQLASYLIKELKTKNRNFFSFIIIILFFLRFFRVCGYSRRKTSKSGYFSF